MTFHKKTSKHISGIYLKIYTDLYDELYMQYAAKTAIIIANTLSSASKQCQGTKGIIQSWVQLDSTVAMNLISLGSHYN